MAKITRCAFQPVTPTVGDGADGVFCGSEVSIQGSAPSLFSCGSGSSELRPEGEADTRTGRPPRLRLASCAAPAVSGKESAAAAAASAQHDGTYRR